MWYHHRSRIWHKLLFMIWCRQNASNSPVRWWIHKFYVSILNDWTLFLEYVAKNNLCASILLRNHQRFYCLILVVLLHGILFLWIFSVDDADQQYYKLDRMFTQHEHDQWTVLLSEWFRKCFAILCVKVTRTLTHTYKVVGLMGTNGRCLLRTTYI